MALTRKPAVTGSFYPSDKAELKQIINDLLKKIKIPSSIQAEKIKAVIVPHAGYFYSGLTAAYSYKALANRKDLGHFILLGPSHYSFFKGAVQDASTFWQTPLGKVEIKHLAEKPPLTTGHKPHLQEHSLEVQIPFLQSLFNKFKITPIVTGEACDHHKLALIFKKHFVKNTMLVISSDLSHFHPQDIAEKIDTATTKQILDLNDQEISKEIYEACGKKAILTSISLAKLLNWKPKLIHYETSSAASGDQSRVVGYPSIIFLKR